MRIGGLSRIAHAIKLYPRWKKCNSYKPLYVELLVSSRCNSRCVMCNIWKLAREKPEVVKDELSTQDYTNLLNELSEAGTKRIFISGGEPLLREDILDIIGHAKRRMQVELVTNGMLVTETTAEGLVRSGLDAIDFSIDGAAPEIHEKFRRVRGGWQRAIRGIELINCARKLSNTVKPSITISYTLSSINYQYVDEMVDIKSELGYDAIHFNLVIGKTPEAEALFLTDDDLSDLETRLDSLRTKFRKAGLPQSQISPLVRICRDKEGTTRGRYAESFNRRVLCFAPWEMTTIDPFGNVYPCCFACTFQNLAEDLEHSFWGKDNYCMGNIKGSSFNQIWNGDKYTQFRSECKKLPSFPFCAWCGYRSLNDAILTGLYSDRSLLLRIMCSAIRKRLEKSDDFEEVIG
jgi:MoaA/NifB/PqqE/SkfB family radical SAM enzyme